MYYGRILAVVTIVYFSIHIAIGLYTCHNEFCPGDSESDWVYEFTDDDGKRYIVIDDKPILKDSYDRNLGIGKYSKEQE
jgi:hypothetical protein